MIFDGGSLAFKVRRKGEPTFFLVNTLVMFDSLIRDESGHTEQPRKREGQLSVSWDNSFHLNDW